jgi:hypothetical protein
MDFTFAIAESTLVTIVDAVIWISTLQWLQRRPFKSRGRWIWSGRK